jgi:oxygen-independent coproporphyrinogen III oxidase
MNLDALLAEPYAAYAYAYPHKTAYRAFDPPIDLAAAWAQESRHALSGYVHIPFCAYRCGFCNLFALGAPRAGLVDAFLSALERQIATIGRTLTDLGNFAFARFAIGGGTPSFLSEAQFEQLLAALHRHLGVDFSHTPLAIEVAPDSASTALLRTYRAAGVQRISMGVQSFLDHELDALARPHQRDQVTAAIADIRRLGFATLNLDLIYGIAGQSVSSFMRSLESALAFQPEELYLYPLYVRALTGLDKARRTQGLSLRAQMYQSACEVLQSSGYVQQSLRMFRRADAMQSKMPDYRCQDDGMLGLGCGARSYTRTLHYSDEYAVGRSAVTDLIAHYAQLSDADFAQARYGYELDADDQRRRYLLQSLLLWPGLELAAYRERFGSEVMADFPQLDELCARGLAVLDAQGLSLTAKGMAHADVYGPWLSSPAVQARMEAYATR